MAADPIDLFRDRLIERFRDRLPVAELREIEMEVRGAYGGGESYIRKRAQIEPHRTTVLRRKRRGIG